MGDLHVSAGWRYRAVEGNQDRRDGRGGVLEARSTEEGGELARRRNPLEGRGGHKGRPDSGIHGDTQRSSTMSTQLSRLSELAKADKTTRFLSIAHLVTPAALMTAFESLR